MVSYIKVNTSRLNKDAQTVEQCIKNMKTEMGKMKTSVKQLDQMWDGSSSEAFKKAFQDDMEALNTILKNLDSIHQYETTAKSKYDACETKVNSLVDEIKI